MTLQRYGQFGLLLRGPGGKLTHDPDCCCELECECCVEGSIPEQATVNLSGIGDLVPDCTQCTEFNGSYVFPLVDHTCIALRSFGGVLYYFKCEFVFHQYIDDFGGLGFCDCTVNDAEFGDQRENSSFSILLTAKFEGLLSEGVWDATKEVNLDVIVDPRCFRDLQGWHVQQWQWRKSKPIPVVPPATEVFPLHCVNELNDVGYPSIPDFSPGWDTVCSPRNATGIVGPTANVIFS